MARTRRYAADGCCLREKTRRRSRILDRFQLKPIVLLVNFFFDLFKSLKRLSMEKDFLGEEGRSIKRLRKQFIFGRIA